jgi:hypothetical protein
MVEFIFFNLILYHLVWSNDLDHKINGLARVDIDFCFCFFFYSTFVFFKNMFLVAEIIFFFFYQTRGSSVDSLARNRALGEGLTRNIGNSISLLASNQSLTKLNRK